MIVDSKLSSDSHIFAKKKKAKSIIAVFKKAFIKMTIIVFINVYKGLIRPHLEFCNQAWYPRLKKNTRLIENVQRRATQMVQGLQTLSYNERFKKLDLPSVEYRIRRGTMIKMFKIGYNPYDPKAIKKGMFELNNPDTRTNQGQLRIAEKLFTIRSATDWNLLPGEVIDSKTVNAFKNNLDKKWKKRGINKFEMF